ncbi:hypothetical protein Pdsh_04015 [Pyrodictium delaneyi]|uniref:DUF371 domain-containing protein n=1 Tax=Pyrodictium delaneyi TaxID=1273541 RepID=A0A211YQ70_9CREN|nr:hypothetical protein Pdsh_04015 [Pyrodictium delaneyi]
MCIKLLQCRGHPNVQLSHPSTLELEKEASLTPRGDCIACVSCKGDLGECVEEKGLAALYIAALSFFPPGVASTIVSGLSPAARPRRLIARRSCHRVDSIVIAANRAAADVPENLRRLLMSSYTRCLALYLVLAPDDNVDTVYESVGCIVEDMSDRGASGDSG